MSSAVRSSRPTESKMLQIGPGSNTCTTLSVKNLMKIEWSESQEQALCPASVDSKQSRERVRTKSIA